MGLTATLVALYSNASTVATSAKDLSDFLRERVRIEHVLADLVERRFTELLPRLRHAARGGEPTFRKRELIDELSLRELPASKPEELTRVIVPLVRRCIFVPGALHPSEDVDPVIESVVRFAVTGMWRQLGYQQNLANVVIAEQGRVLTDQQAQLQADLRSYADTTNAHLSLVDERLTELTQAANAFRSFATDVFRDGFDALLAQAPPAEHHLATKTYRNPFLLVRAEDFNHNYGRLARLFQGSPEWESIQRKSDTVFIEGTRGTGKSMILRRMTAQATLAAKRVDDPHCGFDAVAEEYFGVYVKLSRGYYDQFAPRAGISDTAMALLAQHELNVEICNAFVDALLWLDKERALPTIHRSWSDVAGAVAALFPLAPQARSLAELQSHTLQAEQERIIAYYRDNIFGGNAEYSGSAQDSVAFMRRLAAIFRQDIFPDREVRLFLLLDEFETLTHGQQVAINTLIKMRLPDLTLKVGVRQDGRKTAETFTPSDPIQDPRDFTAVKLDYQVKNAAYRRFLEGIAHMRLREAGYDGSIRDYLGVYDAEEEVPREWIDAELERMWAAGSRRTNKAMNAEFRRKYTWTAVYRARFRKTQRKLYFGIDQFVLLSSGVVSNFIELCKYAFFFALDSGLVLDEMAAVPKHVQADAVDAVSQRLLATIDGNVPVVGSDLQRLIVDLGSILRVRLLNHSSDPEANRISLRDFGSTALGQYPDVAAILKAGSIWSVLHVEGPGQAFRPRTTIQPRGADVIINRIYCPALGISPRARWRLPMDVSDLAGLLQPETRNDTFARLVKSLGYSNSTQAPDEAQSDLADEGQ